MISWIKDAVKVLSNTHVIGELLEQRDQVNAIREGIDYLIEDNKVLRRDINRIDRNQYRWKEKQANEDEELQELLKKYPHLSPGEQPSPVMKPGADTKRGGYL